MRNRCANIFAMPRCRPTIAALLPLLLTLGCAQVWYGKGGGISEQAKISDAYGNSVYLFGDIKPEDVAPVAPPTKLRPCCAFGSGLEVSVGKLPIHGFSLDNFRSPADLGHHNYDNGLISLGGSDGAMVSNEHNGLLYTCRAGFIDAAHVRDYADWMLFLTAWTAHHLETGGEILLSSEAGVRKVVLEPLPRSIIEQERVRGLSLALAEYVAFRLSVWHEIATWYGWSAIALFPERASAFSLEDLYSNLLGIKLVRSMVEVGGTTSEEMYNRNLDRWLAETLRRLGAIDAEYGVQIALALDGYWWDSTKRLPDPRLVMRRFMETGHEIRPWLASDAGSNEVDSILERVCARDKGRVTLGNPEKLGLNELSDWIRIEVDVDPEIENFDLPRPPSRIVTSDDFPEIIESIRQAARVEFGPGADVPSGDGAPTEPLRPPSHSNPFGPAAHPQSGPQTP